MTEDQEPIEQTRERIADSIQPEADEDLFGPREDPPQTHQESTVHPEPTETIRPMVLVKSGATKEVLDKLRNVRSEVQQLGFAEEVIEAVEFLLAAEKALVDAIALAIKHQES